jgi:hypothetical protein
MNRQTLALREKVLRREHPDTLTSTSNLALVLGSQGKYGDAEAMNQQTLAEREKVLELEHLDTLISVYCRCFIHEPNEGLKIRFDQVINGGDAEDASPNERVFWLRSHYSNKITKCQSS